MEAQARHKDTETREAKKAGRAATKADNNTIVGRDCKCVAGLRVLPADHDIAYFVGEGIVEMVSVKGDRARVRHLGTQGQGKEGEHVRDYDIGHDLNFELKLVPGEDVIEFEHEDEAFTNNDAEVISPARLMKIVREHSKNSYMQHKQALGLCIDCVNHYYKAHCEDVNQDQLLQLMRKVRFRIKKIQELIKDGSCQALSVSVVDDLPRLRAALSKFYTEVEAERAITHSLIHEQEMEIADLHEKLQTRHPGEHAAQVFHAEQVEHEVSHHSTASGSSGGAPPAFLTGRRQAARGQPAFARPKDGPRKDVATMMREASSTREETSSTRPPTA